MSFRKCCKKDRNLITVILEELPMEIAERLGFRRGEEVMLPWDSVLVPCCYYKV